jgi:hypothetical protein
MLLSDALSDQGKLRRQDKITSVPALQVTFNL